MGKAKGERQVEFNKARAKRDVLPEEADSLPEGPVPMAISPQPGVPEALRGISAPVSIVKIRKNAYQTLVRALFTYGEEINVKPTAEGIYVFTTDKINDTRIIINLNGIPSVEFNVCSFGSIFDGAEENETYEDDQEGGALTRKDLDDNFAPMLQLDQVSLQIILYLIQMYKTSGSPSSQRAYNILRDFIIVASGKEYLDIGQLYAILY
jgi:hypothetical protein